MTRLRDNIRFNAEFNNEYMNIKEILVEYGFSDKEIQVYLALMELNTAPARNIARKAGVNRGTSYDILKKFVSLGLASFYSKGKQFFTVESPSKLLDLMEEKQNKMQRLKVKIENAMPDLVTMFMETGGRPAVRVYEGTKGIKNLLNDILVSVAGQQQKEYFVYSSSTEQDRQIIYKDFPKFNEKRIEAGIKVKTISLGQGGSEAGLDDRKWLKGKENQTSLTHEILYSGKVAFIGKDNSGSLFGTIIENKGIYEMQRTVFEHLWSQLKN